MTSGADPALAPQGGRPAGDGAFGSPVTYVGEGGLAAPAIYVIDSPEHPFDLGPLAAARTSTIVSVPVRDWDANLTPWPAEALYRGRPDFAGRGPATLATLRDTLVPAVEREQGLVPSRRAICGYSLGGLFALYALTHDGLFCAGACLSGSVWYPGWVEHLAQARADLAGRFAYLSVGTKEKRGTRPLMRTVQDRMEACAGILEGYGCEVRYRTGPGNHMQHVPERYDAGLTALDEFLSRGA